MIAIPAPLSGYKRQWLRCRTCQCVQYYDYVPYSLSDPIHLTRCGHGIAARDLGCDDISADEALVALTTAATEETP
jgi:hypothetical protein